MTRLRNTALTDLVRPVEAEQARDQAWTTFVPLRILPHPLLSANQKQVVRAEYFNGSAARTETVRAALVPYLVHELQAAVDTAKQQPPDYQLCIDDVEAIAQWLMPNP